ncbi:hypothetical protein A3D78_07715 [Candidatus Gottesmanbacteria bacterium RIFCSPHIGHO2_02_FULL_39_14]|uniref:Rieske domain-containing protein n=2 Tax=Candidatus Gottesmaniibacteriota TaxID=1752720 RepID=A0A1F5ZW15_9BACT|nr:MAG: hypothetical protein A3D78_07715 [Candidatus Gottesmanbacteria bacterium RIFCSPHIGHO2_02_FULL_39_14]OGG30983.1 MAG: hypothetical protein A3I51_03255 [Candidatus Gottesmanbacteria bacterium RIFCSPLOWO2_02_FULL_38_8]
MAQYQKIASISEITDGKMKEFKVNGKTIVIANVTGEFLAFDGICTHAQCALAGGFLDGYTLTCYCHGGQFDVKSGEVLSPPPVSPINIYPVKVESDDILVEI